MTCIREMNKCLRVIFTPRHHLHARVRLIETDVKVGKIEFTHKIITYMWIYYCLLRMKGVVCVCLTDAIVTLLEMEPHELTRVRIEKSPLR